MIHKIGWKEIFNLLMAAKKRIVLVLPAIHKELVRVIKEEIKEPLSEILVCIDNNEDVIRKGYGSEKSIELLKGVGATINECNGLRINFICVDDKAYCLFLESRILSGNPEGYNAIELDNKACENIINLFFPVEQNIEGENDKEIISQPLQELKAIEVRKSLEKKPPEEPDLKRKISTYTTLFQYAELHFEGSNLSSKTITIPSDALPFKDVELKKRLKTRINLFTKETTEKWTEFSDLKAEVEKVRKEYLVPCNLRKEKSILKKEKKANFQKAV